MANEKAVMAIHADLTKVRSELRAFRGDMKKTFKDEAKKVSSSYEKSMKKNQSAVKSLGKEIVGLFAFAKVNSFVQESIELYGIQADAEAQLANALGYTSEKLLNVASSQQKLTLFGDEATIAMQSQLATFIKNEDQLARLTPGVQDLAQKLGMDLEQAGQLVAKSIGSSTNALSRYGITIEGNAGSSERFESALIGLENAFGGSAEAAAKAGTGGMKQFQNELGDAKELVGEMIVGELNNFSQWFMTSEVPITSVVENIGSTFSTVFRSMAIVTNTTVLTITKQFEWAIDGIAIALDALPDAIVPDGWVDGLNQAGSDLEEFNDGMVIGLEELAQEIADTWSGEETVKSTETFKETVNKNVAAPLKAVKEDLKQIDSEFAKLQGKSISGQDLDTSDRESQILANEQAASNSADARAMAEIRANEEIADSDKKVADERRKTMDELGSVTQSTFETAFRDVYENGENAFSALGNAFKDEFMNQAIKGLAGLATNALFSGVDGGSGAGGSLIGKLFGFASGTNYAPGGMAMVGERGPELMSVPQGSQIQPSHSTNTTNNFTQTINMSYSGENAQQLSRTLNDLKRRGFSTNPKASYAFAGAQ